MPKDTNRQWREKVNRERLFPGARPLDHGSWEKARGKRRLNSWTEGRAARRSGRSRRGPRARKCAGTKRRACATRRRSPGAKTLCSAAQLLKLYPNNDMSKRFAPLRRDLPAIYSDIESLSKTYYVWKQVLKNRRGMENQQKASPCEACWEI
jgi:hypothetical protein